MDDNIKQVLARVDQRMDRFEKGLDGIQAAIVQMARAEERTVTLQEQNTTLFRKIDDLEMRMRIAEQSDALQSKSLGLFERLGWIAITTGASLVAAYLSWVMK